jgi:hypothetical protein
MSSGAAAGATALTFDVVDDLNLIVAGTQIFFPATNEVVTVTADYSSAGALTVARGASGTTAGSIADNAEAYIIGSAFSEGGSSPTAVSFDPTTDFNYTQIFKTSVQVSGTLQNTYLRTGDKEQEQLTKALKMHMGDIERAFFFGHRHEANGSSATPTRTTGGLLSQINNVSDAASAFATANTITEKEFDQLLIEDLFAYGSTEKVMFAGPRVISNLMQISKNRWQPTQVDNAYGVSFTRYTTFAGDLLVYLHPMFRQLGMNESAVILDMPNINYRYMAGRDTQLLRDIQNNDFDGVKHMYMSECGLELLQSKPHHVIKNWSAV